MCLLLSAGLRYKLLEAHQGGQSPGYGYLQRMGRGEHQRDQLSSAHWSAQETPSMGTHQGAQTSPGSGSLLIKPDSRENIQHVSVVSKNFRKLFCTFELKLCPFVALKAVPKRLKIQSNNDQDKMFPFSSIAVRARLHQPISQLDKAQCALLSHEEWPLRWSIQWCWGNDNRS